MAAQYLINHQVVSDSAFYQVACNPARNVAVEACAGAGKTWMLVSRIVRALLEGAEPQQILAITFTRKASAEMLERLNEWLHAFSQMPLDQLEKELCQRGMEAQQAKAQAPQLKGLYLRLLQQGRSVQMQTFHGWFSSLLRAAPMHVLDSLQLPAQYELQEEESQVVAHVWRPFYALLHQDAALMDDYRAVMHAVGSSKLEALLTSAVALRAQIALVDAHVAGGVEASVPSFKDLPDYQLYHQFDDPLEWLAKPEVEQKWQSWAQAWAAEKAKTPQQKAALVQQGFAAATLQERYGYWRAAVATASDTPIANMQKFNGAQEGFDETEALRLASEQHQGHQFHVRVTRLARAFIGQYQQVKLDNGWIDMGDLERAATALLTNETTSGWVQERLDATIRHVLMDEFQDTNPLQWQALHGWLSSYAGDSQRPSLFIVGDPKQSIYRFRGAEPEVFRTACQFVQDSFDGVLLGCDHTRRNSAAVMTAVNKVMGGLEQAKLYPGFRDHTTGSEALGMVGVLPMVPRIEASPTQVGESPWRDSLTQPKELPADKQRQRECAQAASWLQCAMQQTGLTADDLLVMARTNESLQEMQQELTHLGIASHLVEKKHLSDAQEVQDIVALVDVLVSPQHNVSLARVLKSPLFGWSDRALAQLVQALPDTQESWLAFLTNQTESLLVDPLWSRTGMQLARWQRWVRERLLHDALDAMYHDGDVLAKYAASTPEAMRHKVLAHLQALPSHALNVDGGRFTSAYQWVRTMRLADSTKAPSAATPRNSVRLLTVHGAKGLEAPLVLLLNTNPNRNNQSSQRYVLCDWPAGVPHPRGVVFMRGSKEAPPSVQVALTAEEHAQSLEERNALYVALTRARDMLVLSHSEPYQSGHPYSWWKSWNTYYPEAQELQRDDSGHWLTPAGGWPTLQGVAVAAAQPQVLGTGLYTVPPLPPELQRHSQMTTAHLDKPSEASRKGQALHQLLEWGAGSEASATDTVQRYAAVLVRQFAISHEAASAVCAAAHVIRHGEAAWVWHDTQYAANEVELAWQGQLLRLDRLVQQASTGTWWVIDYKSALEPLQDASLRQQLSTYWTAVKSIREGEEVRAAFVGADGRLHEWQAH